MLIEKISEDFDTQYRITILKDLPRKLTLNSTSYVLVRSPDNNIYLFTKPQIPSQYMRKIIVETFRLKESWDWRSSISIQNLRGTLDIFKSKKFIKKRIYFAHLIEGAKKQDIDQMVEESRRVFSEECPDFEIFSMSQHIDEKLAHAIDSQENCDSILISFELHFLRFSDILVVNLSYPNWQYVGAIMEVVYAYNIGIPVIAIVRNSSIANRRWLRGHVHAFVSNIKEAAVLVKNEYQVILQ